MIDVICKLSVEWISIPTAPSLLVAIKLLNIASRLHNVKRNFLRKLLPLGNLQRSNKTTSIRC